MMLGDIIGVIPSNIDPLPVLLLASFVIAVVIVLYYFGDK